MKDPRFRILEELTKLLKKANVPVYSVIPDNSDKPFIYMGDIQLAEIQDKSGFLVEGLATIELYSGSTGWVGSIAPLLDTLYTMKYYLQPHKGSVIDIGPAFQMIYWKLYSDSGLVQYSVSERLHVATLQYSFKLKEASGYVERIESDKGIIEAIECIPIQFR